MLVAAPARPDSPENELRESLLKLGNLGLSDRDVLQVQVADPDAPRTLRARFLGVTLVTFPTPIGYSSYGLE